ncbi:YoaP domain-containing protein [Lentimicrobium sp.]|uniref:YoaP domain-containing protein n=1 Tax=Lentimicrobium sp. TaxID=2034841 RepID=UPI003A522015
MKEAAVENHLELCVTRLETPEQARHTPTGYGTFGLIKDGKLLADHYISKTRFLNILRKEI